MKDNGTMGKDKEGENVFDRMVEMVLCTKVCEKRINNMVMVGSSIKMVIYMRETESKTRFRDKVYTNMLMVPSTPVIGLITYKKEKGKRYIMTFQYSLGLIKMV